MADNIIPESPNISGHTSCIDLSASIQHVNDHNDSYSSSASQSGSHPSSHACNTGPALHIFRDPATAPIRRLADINTAALLTDPFASMLNVEKTGKTEHTHEMLVGGNVARIRQKLSNGAIMVATTDFTAVACWEPPSCSTLMEEADGDLSFSELATRPMMQDCFRQWASQRRKAMAGREYWHLTLMARDPARKGVKGAVRAVLDIGMAWAEQEGRPIWLEAGNERAREVYAAFGFEEVGVTWHGIDGAVKLPIWLMVKEPRGQR